MVAQEFVPGRISWPSEFSMFIFEIVSWNSNYTTKLISEFFPMRILIVESALSHLDAIPRVLVGTHVTIFLCCGFCLKGYESRQEQQWHIVQNKSLPLMINKRLQFNSVSAGAVEESPEFMRSPKVAGYEIVCACPETTAKDIRLTSFPVGASGLSTFLDLWSCYLSDKKPQQRKIVTWVPTSTPGIAFRWDRALSTIKIRTGKNSKINFVV